MKHLLFLPLSLLLVACSAYRSSVGAESPRQQTYAEPDPIVTSLFRGEDSTISEADIQRILNGEVRLPAAVRLAILNLESVQRRHPRNYYYGYYNSELYRNLQARYFDTLRTKLTATGRTERISLLPQLLVGEDPDLFSLRESAVRMQADALLIFSVESDIYSESKLFKRNEVKAYATIEGLLLDIRSGVVVFSTTVSAEATGIRKEEDTGDEDFQRRIQRWASLRATG